MFISILLAQLTHENNGVFQNSIFPLGAGYGGASLIREFNEKVSIEIFKTPNDLSEKCLLTKPHIIMLGCYLWNMNLSLAFAKKIISLDSLKINKTSIISKKLRQIIGKYLLLQPTDFQINSVNLLLEQMTNKEEAIAKLAYRLRPVNMILKEDL